MEPLSTQVTANGVTAASKPASEAVLIELFKQKQLDANNLVNHVIRGLTMYLAVVGALFKFALDSAATPSLRMALSTMGICICVLGFVMVLWAEKVRPALQDDIKHVLVALNAPAVPETLLPLRYLHAVCAILNVLCLGAWIYIAFTKTP